MKQLNSLFLAVCLAFGSCANEPQENQIQSVSLNTADSIQNGSLQFNERIGVWNEEDKKSGVRIESWYGYNKGKSEREFAKYYYHDTLVMDVYFRYGFIRDTDIKRPEYVTAVYPFIDNALGENLFSQNCGNCHSYFPNMMDKPFAQLVKRKHENGSLAAFIHEGKQPNENDSLLLLHPEMQHLDTIEINALVKYVTVSNTQVVY